MALPLQQGLKVWNGLKEEVMYALVHGEPTVPLWWKKL